METWKTIGDIGKALALEFAANLGARLGGDVTVAPSAPVTGHGILVTLAANGPVSGPVIIWIDGQGLGAIARRLLGLDREATSAEVEPLVTEVLGAACQSLLARPESAGLTFGPPAFSAGTPARDAHTFFLAVPNVASCQLAVGGVLPPLPPPAPAPAAPAQADARLDAVLDVDLPLVVRFGRAVLMLRAIAELGPGSVVDMGRSPDEPVELLVGDRLIARGEVVIVGGNYGVRITELTEGRQAAAQLETRLS